MLAATVNRWFDARLEVTPETQSGYTRAAVHLVRRETNHFGMCCEIADIERGWSLGCVAM